MPATIQLTHWNALVPGTSGAERLLAKDLATMASNMPGAADTLIAQMKRDGIDHAILATIRDIIETRAGHLLRIAAKP